MTTFVTVAVILAMIVVGVLLIRLLNSQHGDRMAAIHYGHTGMPVEGPAPSARRKARGRLRLRRRARKQARYG
ncbi:hypothetical protein [Streptomyces purpurascens]|uniref:Secreted protein n=1 Tax=Streptomyces purpurascens TaxID=1924 RepID=A0ABZ1MME3_STREF|nr:hypothetical protein [Streptomyces purpurascens]MCE7049050.1 hypothetical protein [Streptomyces purpurascens]